MQIKTQKNEEGKMVRRWQIAFGIASFLLIVISVHAYWYWDHASVHFEERMAQYPLIDPARHIIPKEHFISTLQPLRERLTALVENEKDLHIALYVEFLNTGANISINEDDRFWPASLAKLPLAVAVMGAIEQDIWSLDDVLTLEDGDRSERSSSLHTYPNGEKFTIQKLLEELLIKSDNTAFLILERNIPKSEIERVREGLGLENLFDASGEVSAKEFSRIFRALYTASYLNREHSQFLLDLLNRSDADAFLRQPVPHTIPFPHKYGLYPELSTYNDAGIVYVPNRPFLITVMIQGNESVDVGSDRILPIMHAISNASLQFFTEVKAPEISEN